MKVNDEFDSCEDHLLLCCACTMLMRCDAMLSLQCSIYARSVLARSLYNLGLRQKGSLERFKNKERNHLLYNPKIQYTIHPPSRTPNPKKLV